MLRVTDNPPVRPPQVESVVALPGPWWVVHTKARFEKALAWDLIAKDVNYFLPLVKRVSFSGGRKRLGMMPLFTSYLFLNGDAETRQIALQTNRASTVFPVTDRELFVSQIAAVERALDADVPIDCYPQLAVGRACRVTRGPLLGKEGVVVRRDGVETFVINVSLLGQGVAVSITPDFLEAID